MTRGLHLLWIILVKWTRTLPNTLRFDGLSHANMFCDHTAIVPYAPRHPDVGHTTIRFAIRPSFMLIFLGVVTILAGTTLIFRKKCSRSICRSFRLFTMQPWKDSGES